MTTKLLTFMMLVQAYSIHTFAERTFTVVVGLARFLCEKVKAMNRIIWIIGAIVIVLAILSFLGLR
jgi:hypothetical protein